VRVDLINVLAKFASLFSLNFLDLLEATTLDEGALGLEVLGENLSKLGTDVGKDVVGGQLEQGLEGGHMSAHLDDILEGLLRLVLEVLRGLLEHVDGKEAGRNVSLSEVFSVLGGVATDLSKRPGSGSFQVILRFVHQSVLERCNTLGDDDSHSKRVIESRDIAEGHDTGKASIALALTDVVDGSSGSTRVDNELCELSSLLSNLTNASGGILTDLDVDVLQAVEDAGEDLSLHDHFSKVNGVLGDLGEALADVTLKLGIGMRDKSGEVGNGTLVDDCLGKLLSVLSDLRKSGC